MIPSSIPVSDEIQLLGFFTPLKEIRDFGEHIYLNECRC